MSFWNHYYLPLHESSKKTYPSPLPAPEIDWLTSHCPQNEKATRHWCPWITWGGTASAQHRGRTRQRGQARPDSCPPIGETEKKKKIKKKIGKANDDKVRERARSHQQRKTESRAVRKRETLPIVAPSGSTLDAAVCFAYPFKLRLRISHLDAQLMKTWETNEKRKMKKEEEKTSGKGKVTENIFK